MKSEWKECALSDVIELTIDHRGKTPKKLGGDWSNVSTPYKALSAKNIKTGQVVQPETIRYVDERLYRLWMRDEILPGDILVTSEAPFGQLYLWKTNEKIVLSQRLFGLRVKQEVNPCYVYYYMITPKFQGELHARATGTTVEGLRQPELLKCKLYLPSLVTQRKIAAVLSSLDAKIETNNAICRNLEEMSRCVLSEWLTAEARNVEYIPLSELADINAKTYSEKEKWPFVYYLDTGSITNGRVDSLAYIDVNKEKLPSRARRKISMGDIVYSTVRPTQRHFGIIYDVQPNMLVSTGFAVICSNCTDVCNELIYIMLTDPTFVESMQQIGEQSVSTYPSVNPADIATCSIPVSKEVSYQKIQDVIQSNFKKIGDLQKENCRLSALRDTLLPRLMSGELGVSAVNLR